MFEQELDNALEAGYKYIIIEPTQLADETVRWITVGNFLSKTAIISGALSAGTGLELYAFGCSFLEYNQVFEHTVLYTLG